MGKSDRETFVEIYLNIRKPIWIYAKEIYNGSNSSYETNNGVLYGKKRDLHMVFIDFEKACDKVLLGVNNVDNITYQ